MTRRSSHRIDSAIATRLAAFNPSYVLRLRASSYFCFPQKMLREQYQLSYSRWKDERFWPLFRDALMREHPSLTPEGLCKAREFNAQRSA